MNFWSVSSSQITFVKHKQKWNQIGNTQDIEIHHDITLYFEFNSKQYKLVGGRYPLRQSGQLFDQFENLFHLIV